MFRIFTNVLSVSVLLSALAISDVSTDHDWEDTEFAAQQVDCILTPGGSCGNKDAACNRRGGSCSVGGVNGEDGWHDLNADGCGCQL